MKILCQQIDLFSKLKIDKMSLALLREFIHKKWKEKDKFKSEIIKIKTN